MCIHKSFHLDYTETSSPAAADNIRLAGFFPSARPSAWFHPLVRGPVIDRSHVGPLQHPDFPTNHSRQLIFHPALVLFFRGKLRLAAAFDSTLAKVRQEQKRKTFFFSHQEKPSVPFSFFFYDENINQAWRRCCCCCWCCSSSCSIR